MPRRDFKRRKPYRYRPPQKRRSKRSKSGTPAVRILITAALVGTFGGLVYTMASKEDGSGGDIPDIVLASPVRENANSDFSCRSVVVVDGDTFRCDGERIRLQGIDAPELDGHCTPGRQCTPGDPVASTDHLRTLVARGATECRKTDIDGYGRTVARCTSGGADLSCEQVRSGHAVLRYAPISC